MDLKVNPTTKFIGEITASGSKSYSHRAFIAASLADGVSIIKNALTSGDVEVTMNSLTELGVIIQKESDNSFLVKKAERFLKPVEKTIDCKNSGTSIRILCALSLLIEGGLTLSGEFLKRKRPIVPLLDALISLGAKYELNENQVKIRREKNICDVVKIPGDISSQFITALLFLGPLLKCDKKDHIELEITTPLVSYPFLQITIDVLRSFGISILEKLNDDKTGTYYINSAQNYRPQAYEIPGDFSSAAFIIVAVCLSPEDSWVTIKNLNIENPQGDKRIITILREMGANIQVDKKENQVIIKNSIKKNPLKGIEIDCNDIPDLFPILSVLGAFAEGKTVLLNARNLRLKESDRIAVMARELNKMGVKTEESEDKLIIHHCEDLKAIEVDHENDHRIAMACCIATLFCNSNSLIKNIEITSDSYPNFVEDLKKLGANLELI